MVVSKYYTTITYVWLHIIMLVKVKFVFRYDFSVSEKEKKKLLADFGGDLTLPENFEITVTPYDGIGPKNINKQPTCQVNVTLSFFFFT